MTDDQACTCDVDPFVCPEHCAVCAFDPSTAHWCMVRGEFAGDPTMGAMEFEMEFGEPPPMGGDGV